MNGEDKYVGKNQEIWFAYVCYHSVYFPVYLFQIPELSVIEME